MNRLLFTLLGIVMLATTGCGQQSNPPIHQSNEVVIQKVISRNPSIKNPDLIFPSTKVNFSSNERQLAHSNTTSEKVTSRSPASEIPVINENPESKVESKGYSLIEVQPQFFYSRLDGYETTTGNSVSLLSKLNYGLNFAWRQVWSDSFESFVSLGFAKFKFTEFSTRHLEGTSQTRSHFEVGTRLRLSSKTRLLISAGAGEELFYRATTTTNVKLNTVMVPKFNTGITQNFFTKKPFTLGMEAKISLASPVRTDEHSIKLGWGYLGRIFIKQEPLNSNLVLQTGFFYGQHLQNTSTLNLKHSDLGVDFGLSWSFGK